MKSIPSLVYLGVALIVADVGGGNVWANALSDSLLSQGRAALESKNFDTANFLMEQAIVADPSNASAYLWLGRLSQEQEDIPRARKYYDTSLGIDPISQDALLWGGEMDLADDASEEAEEKLKRLQVLCGECSAYQALNDMIVAYSIEEAAKAGEDISPDKE
ncbi:MAG: tetratricopeptide repeat protein [Parvularculales bacterium]